jgi:uncharacterized RDD family membrane protein YckC
LLQPPARARRARRVSELQGTLGLPMPPAASKPFTTVLKPVQGVTPAPMGMRVQSLLVDSIVVAVLSIAFFSAALVALRVADKHFPLADCALMPPYLLALAPLVLSLGYKAIWAICENATVGLQQFGLDVRCVDGSRPTIGQRLIRPFAGWMKVASVVGLIWPLVTQEKYSMQDVISQTVVTYRPGYGPED